MRVSYAPLYEAYDAIATDKIRERERNSQARNALQRFLTRTTGTKTRDGFARIQQCRDALDCLDRQGWQRSFHQRMFHENFIRACARVFFKTEPQGSFARAHQAILDLNGWDSLSQEILISTPRRCAARIFSCSRPQISTHNNDTSIHTEASTRAQPVPTVVKSITASRRHVDSGKLVLPTDPDTERASAQQVPWIRKLRLIIRWLAVKRLVAGGSAVPMREKLKVTVPKHLRNRRLWARWRRSCLARLVTQCLALLGMPVPKHWTRRHLSPITL